MAKKRIKNKNRIEAKSESKVLHGLAGSIEEALSEDPSEIEQDEVIVVDVPEHRHKGLAKKIAYFVVGLLIIVFASRCVKYRNSDQRRDRQDSRSDRP